MALLARQEQRTCPILRRRWCRRRRRRAIPRTFFTLCRRAFLLHLGSLESRELLTQRLGRDFVAQSLQLIVARRPLPCGFVRAGRWDRRWHSESPPAMPRAGQLALDRAPNRCCRNVGSSVSSSNFRSRRTSLSAIVDERLAVPQSCGAPTVIVASLTRAFLFAQLPD